MGWSSKEPEQPNETLIWNQWAYHNAEFYDYVQEHFKRVLVRLDPFWADERGEYICYYIGDGEFVRLEERKRAFFDVPIDFTVIKYRLGYEVKAWFDLPYYEEGECE